MVKRKCPQCGIVRLSSDTKDWICEECGAVVEKELSESAMERIKPCRSGSNVRHPPKLLLTKIAPLKLLNALFYLRHLKKF